MRDDRFYYEALGLPVGPLSLRDLRRLISEGAIKAETRIRRGENGRWRVAGELPGFDRVPRQARLIEQAAERPSGRLPRAISSHAAWVSIAVVSVVIGVYLGIVMVAGHPKEPVARSVSDTNTSPPTVEAETMPMATKRQPRVLPTSRRAMIARFRQSPEIRLFARENVQNGDALRDNMSTLWALLDRGLPDSAVAYATSDAMVILEPAEQTDRLRRIAVAWVLNTETLGRSIGLLSIVLQETIPNWPDEDSNKWLIEQLEAVRAITSDEMSGTTGSVTRDGVNVQFNWGFKRNLLSVVFTPSE